MTHAGETIAAIATPGGRGGIGIVRVSGPGSLGIARALCGRTPPPRVAAYCAFRDADGSAIDRGLLIYFRGPASYTGEDVVELHGHGGQVVLQMLLRRVLALGARLARPGEFTERAFLNDKIDLVQAEAVADLIDSLSEAAARSALRSVEGDFSRRIESLRDELVQVRAAVEAALDFPEEADTALRDAGVARRIESWLDALDRVLAAARNGNALRAGLRVVIAGAPNVGKSSLLNRLIGADRAIVHAQPGTTRDTLEEAVELGGIRMHLVDTAGLRAAADPVEEEGVRRSYRAIEGADIVIAMEEYGATDDAGVAISQALSSGKTRRVRVRNKIDLVGAAPAAESTDDGMRIDLSAHTGEGVELLRDALLALGGQGIAAEDALLARARHLSDLAAARDAVARGLQGWRGGVGVELLAEELRAGQNRLGRITGELAPDDLLGEIFARFCIGK